MKRTKRVSVIFNLEDDKGLLTRIENMVGKNKPHPTQTKAMVYIMKDYFKMLDRLEVENLKRMSSVKLCLKWKDDGFQVIDTEIVKDDDG